MIIEIESSKYTHYNYKGLQHRADGPAIHFDNGNVKIWYVLGKNISSDTFNNWYDRIRVSLLGETVSNELIVWLGK